MEEEGEAALSASRREMEDPDTRSDDGIHMSYYGSIHPPMKEGLWLD